MQEASSGFMPVAQNERIHTMDVLRSFALLGIFLMNVEDFARPRTDHFSNLLPTGTPMIDWLTGVFGLLFVTGKFWTLFSLLFGMGFAVMLERATQANRRFIAPYLRRAIALALFGFCHFVFVWDGDILSGYAFSALFLLLVLFARWYWLLLLAVLQLVLMKGLGYGASYVWPYEMLFVFIMSLYLRSDAGVPLFGVRWHVSALWLWALGLIYAGLALAGAGASMMIVVAIMAISGLLAQRFRDPSEQRALRVGIWRYSMGLVFTLLFTAWMWWHPVPLPAEVVAEQVAEQAATISHEWQLVSGNDWWALVQYRLQRFGTGNFMQSSIAMSVFLIGYWFIRSGVMRNVQVHLPMFRKLAFIVLPAGVLLSAVCLWIAPNRIIGNDTPYQIAINLRMFAGLLGALGYLGLVTVLMQGSAAKWLSWLAPAGRMALTNYLMQSVLMGLFFYGYGLGHYGMGRAGQFAFVLVVFAAQVVLSHIWLRYFRYGPFEWLWRSITYWRWQPMHEVVG
jgi:uncharacterized membrane protein YeiB